MKYISTRGKSPKLNFSEVLLTGLAPDGGLYLPETYPRFSDEDLSYMRPMSYQDLAFFIFQKFKIKNNIKSTRFHICILIFFIFLHFI